MPSSDKITNCTSLAQKMPRPQDQFPASPMKGIEVAELEKASGEPLRCGPF